MTELVVVDAVRTPVGKRNGALSGVHPAELLGHAQKALIERTGIDPGDVGQVVGGCVGQVGEQALNIARTAWLGAGLPVPVAATTVDAQCGSSQQATSLAAGLVAAGVVDMAIGCGVESMSRVPMNTNISSGFGDPMPDSFKALFEVTTQFEGAERIAEQWEITRHDTDEFGLLSQQRAAAAWDDGRFDTQIVPVEAPAPDNGHTVTVTRDEGLRATTLEGLAELKPVVREDGVHTAGNASQISDGASAVLVTSAERAKELGLQPKARIVDMCLVGSDPVLMLTGPIEATKKLLSRNSFELSDIDVFEVNEAFASVVLAWQRELDTDLDKTNPNGGAIALGHPLGGTGGILIAKTVHEMERADLNLGLVTMCCGGGLGTGLVLERDLMQVEGAAALVAGGASGLGRATAEALAARGADVTVLDLPVAAERVAGSGLRFAGADVTDPEAVAAAVAAVEGDLRICVNCAGIGPPGKIVGRDGPLDLERFRTVIEVNLIGTFNVARLAAARMMAVEPLDGERGLIVNTASVAAFDGQIGQVSYSASKGGIAAMTLPIARDLSASLIRCVTIAPGIFDTPLLGTLSEEVRASLGASVPHPARLGDPAEYAALVVHAVENQMLNGETIRLDGALRMAPR